jgi:hypothetical protein
VGKASVAQWQQAIIHQGHFAKIWEMAVLLIFLPQFLSILSNLALAKIRPQFWQYSRSG